ncbi:MAG: thioesterase [Acidobacteria bacterium]|nr:thioesterase [Acidobacteriota bacterium]MCA1612292.1 thioesterase [Acidobacteriota bacterium]
MVFLLASMCNNFTIHEIGKGRAMTQGKTIEAGARGEASWVVSETDLASRLAERGGESFPAVFSTARMIALMELAASRILAPHLEPGQESVGVLVHVTHSAATPPGARVTAQATYSGREGKFYAFEVRATDDAGEIGRGIHHRAIVDGRRLLEGAEKRRR